MLELNKSKHKEKKWLQKWLLLQGNRNRKMMKVHMTKSDDSGESGDSDDGIVLAVAGDVSSSEEENIPTVVTRHSGRQ